MSRKGVTKYLAEIQKDRRSAAASANYSKRQFWSRQQRLALGRAEARIALADAAHRKAMLLKEAFGLT